MPTRYIDLSNLEHLFKGDKSLIREWIALYMQESPAYFDHHRRQRLPQHRLI